MAEGSPFRALKDTLGARLDYRVWHKLRKYLTRARVGSPYEALWDSYVEDWDRTVSMVAGQTPDQDSVDDFLVRKTLDQGGVLKHAGDEWGFGNRKAWEGRFNFLFPMEALPSWQHVVEIGAGSGKYTQLVYERNPDIKVLCLDVSRKFLAALKKRFSDRYGTTLFTYHIDATQPFPLEHALSMLKWPKLDAVYSLDAMVHVDLQHLMSYLISASRSLKQDGYLMMILADCTTPQGFKKLLVETPRWFLAQNKPTPKFEWLCPEAVRYVIRHLGFEVVKLESDIRDLFLVARLKKRANIEELLTGDKLHQLPY